MVEFQVDRTIAASPERVFDWLADPAAVLNAIKISTSDAAQQGRFIESAKHHAAKWLPADEIRTFIRAIVTRIQIHANRIDISLDQDRITTWLDGGHDAVQLSANSRPDPNARVLTLTIHAQLRRAGKR